MLCAEAIVLTALGVYGVRKDEEAQTRAAQNDLMSDAGEPHARRHTPAIRVGVFGGRAEEEGGWRRLTLAKSGP